MSAHVSLRDLLATKKDGQELRVDADHPIVVLHLDAPWKCIAVLERTAILVSTVDEHDRYTVRHEYVMVDPAQAIWQEAQGPAHGVSPMRWRKRRANEEERKTARDETDREALANQQEVERRRKHELVEQRRRATVEAAKREAETQPSPPTLRVLGEEELEDNALSEEAARVPSAAQASGHARPTEVRKEEFERAVNRLVRDGHPEPLKFCPGCKTEKPKSDFPTGKGYFFCAECRAARDEKRKNSPYVQAVDRNLELAPAKMKHCPACDKDKDVEDFNRNSSKGDGLQSICKQCQSDRWTAGATAIRRRRDEADKPANISAEVTAEATQPVQPADRPALTFTDLLTDLKQLRADRDSLLAEVAQLRAENQQSRADQAELYDELHAIVGGITKSTKERV